MKLTLPLLSFAASLAPAFADHQTAFESLYPPGAVVWSDEYTGTLSTANGDFAFEIQMPLDFVLRGREHFVTTVRFDTPGPGQMKAFASGAAVVPLAERDFGFHASAQSPGVPTTFEFDSEAFVSGAQDFEVDDFVGIGGPQIRFYVTSYYGQDAPHALIEAERQYLLDPATGDVLLTFTPTRHVLTPAEIVDTLVRTLEIQPRSPFSSAKVVLTDVDTGEVETYGYGPTGFLLPPDTPWVFGPIVPLDPIDLEVRVVDDTGAPLSDALLYGATAQLDLFGNGAVTELFELVTDATGEVVQPVWAAVQVTVERDGFYTWVSDVIPRDDLPMGDLVVQMDPELQRVPMVRSFRTVYQEWVEALGPLEIGLRFVDGYGPESHLAMTTDQSEAAVWFEIDPSSGPAYGPNGDPRFLDWGVSVQGTNGWDVAAGPQEDEPMREAPAGGYVPALSTRVGDLPFGVYVRNAGVKQYGKLWDLDVDAIETAATSRVLLGLRYSVQDGYVGTRSLNPEGESDFGR